MWTDKVFLVKICPETCDKIEKKHPLLFHYYSQYADAESNKIILDKKKTVTA